MNSQYEKAQQGIAMLKGAIYDLLKQASGNGLRNVEVGKGLGIYAGHIGHQGHIPRTLLEIMQSEGVVEQRSDKRWYLVELNDVSDDKE